MELITNFQFFCRKQSIEGRKKKYKHIKTATLNRRHDRCLHVKRCAPIFDFFLYHDNPFITISMLSVGI